MFGLPSFHFCEPLVYTTHRVCVSVISRLRFFHFLNAQNATIVTFCSKYPVFSFRNLPTQDGWKTDPPIQEILSQSEMAGAQKHKWMGHQQQHHYNHNRRPAIQTIHKKRAILIYFLIHHSFLALPVTHKHKHKTKTQT